MSCPSWHCLACEMTQVLSLKPSRGFHAACADIRPERKFLVHPGNEAFPLGKGVKALPLVALMERVMEAIG